MLQVLHDRMGHHAVESKGRALHVGGGVVYVRVGHISIVDLAHLTVLAMFLTSARQDVLRASSLDNVLPQTFLRSKSC